MKGVNYEQKGQVWTGSRGGETNEAVKKKQKNIGLRDTEQLAWEQVLLCGMNGGHVCWQVSICLCCWVLGPAE